MPLIILLPLKNCQEALKKQQDWLSCSREVNPHLSVSPDGYRCTAAPSVPSTPSPSSFHTRYRRCLPHQIFWFPGESCRWRSLFLTGQPPRCSGPRLVSVQDSLVLWTLSQTLNWPIISQRNQQTPSFPPNKGLGGLRDPEVWPGGEVEVADGPHLCHHHYHHHYHHHH